MDLAASGRAPCFCDSWDRALDLTSIPKPCTLCQDCSKVSCDPDSAGANVAGLSGEEGQCWLETAPAGVCPTLPLPGRAIDAGVKTAKPMLLSGLHLAQPQNEVGATCARVAHLRAWDSCC